MAVGSSKLAGVLGPTTIAVGAVATIVGDVELRGDLVVEGLLTSVDTFTLEGNGFQILVRHGGRLDLAGVMKSGWVNWGESVVGWQVGDRLAVAPTVSGTYTPAETIWQGSWAATTRPANSPPVTLVNGQMMQPEVANLGQTVVLRNLKRIMIHEATVPGSQSLKWIRVLDSGETGVLAHYPIHFHQVYENARGSLLEGVVVEGGKNHAFVPHGSHGITMKDCVAFKTAGDAFWWDFQPAVNDFVNDSHDIDWDHCLVLQVMTVPESTSNIRLAGFVVGAGLRNRCADSVASCVAGASGGPRQRSGFHWPEKGLREPWDFVGNLAHNNGDSGSLAWQNNLDNHNPRDFTAYNNGLAGINHGAYRSAYRYVGAVLGGTGLLIHAVSGAGENLLFEEIISDADLVVTKHAASSVTPMIVRRCRFPRVLYAEIQGDNSSYAVYEDCGFTPTTFDLAGVHPGSVIEITEGGVLINRWASGAWS